MEEELKEQGLHTQELLADRETKLLEERQVTLSTEEQLAEWIKTHHSLNKAEGNPGVRKSSRPRKQSKRVLDSADCNDVELLGISFKKKHRKDLKLKICHKKDILPNGRPFKCSLCESPYINNSPAKAKIKKELQPIVKEKFGQLLLLCVKCAIAVNHTENKGPTPQQRAEFEEDGRQFAQQVVEYLNDKAAARLYCSFYQTTKCGCIQCYITGTPAGRKRKTSLPGMECTTTDTTELKLEEGAITIDDKAEQAQRARYLLGLLKESLAKKQIPNAKKSNEKLQLAPDDTVNTMKESERFILENRVKLKELGICERGCQKVLCYSNNFLHKKSVGSQPRLQRTRGRAALGRLHALQDLHKMRCCEKCCVKLAEKNQAKMALWRQRAQQGQKEMWKVLEEMLTSTESGKNNCFKFISMVTGCCLTTVQKVYADVLLSKGTAGCASKREHGMRFHWKRQKELGKKGQTVTAAVMQSDQSQVIDPQLISHTPVTSDICPLITNQAVMPLSASEIKNELKFHCQPQPLMMGYETVCSQAQVQSSSQLCENNVDENEDKRDIKEKFLQLFDIIKDAQDIANMHEILAKLHRDMLTKQEKEGSQKGFSSQASVHVSGSVADSLLPSASTSLSVMLNSSNSLSCTSSATSGTLHDTAHDQYVSSINNTKQGRPFVHIKVQQTVPELKSPMAHIPQFSSRKQRASTTSTDVSTLYHAADINNSAKEVKLQAVNINTTQTEALSSQLLSQPLDLSNLTTNSGTDNPELNEAPRVSLPLGSNSTSPFVIAPHVTVSSMADNSLGILPQQVGLFQVMPHPDAENLHLTTPASQILSVYPQQTPLQIQPLPLSTSNHAQHIQFQLVSPLILGQSDILIPLNQAGTMPLIIPKQPTSDLQNSETFLQTLSLSCGSSVCHKDSAVNEMSTMQQSIQNIPESSQTLLNSNDVPRNKLISGLSSHTDCNLSFSKNSCHINKVKQSSSLLSQSSSVDSLSECVQSHNLSFDQVSGATDGTPSLPLKPQYSYSSTNTQSVMNFQGIQNTGQDAEAVHQVTNIDHYFPSSLMSQGSGGNIVVGTPSCSSGSFVFDALADSPVKDSISMSSPLLQTAPVVTSSLLCEILMRSTAPSASVSSISSSHMQDCVSSLATSTTQSQSPRFQGSPIACSTKSSLLISALKSTPLSSAYCQSLNFNTNTTPSTMSNQPMVMTSKVEQTNFPVAVTIGQSTSLAHCQIGMSRLNRQREPPQVGIVHPHISGVKGGSGHSVSSTFSNSHNSTQTINSSSTPSSSMNHANLLGESLLPSSSIITLDSTNLQMAASVQDIPTDISAVHPQHQHLLLSLLLNSQQAANITDQSLINTPQIPGQFNLTALLGNPVINSASLNDLDQNHSADTQKITNIVDYNAIPHDGTAQGSQYTDRSNILPDQSYVIDQTSVSLGNQNIIFGNNSGQQHTDNSQLFQNLTASNTGHVKLIPLILSGSSGNSSATNLFSQSGQLLLNMSPCSGLGNVSSLSPQNLNRDNSILLNMSPTSNQNMQLLHVVGSAQTTPSLPLLSPNIQNIHQSLEVSSAPSDQTKTYQFNVLPLVSSQTVPQTKSQTNSFEFQNTNNNQNHLPTYTLSGPVGPVAEVVHAYKHHSGKSYSESYITDTHTSKNFVVKDTKNFQTNLVSRGDSSSSHNIVFSTAADTITAASVSSSKEDPQKSVEIIGGSLSRSTLTTKKKNINLTQIDDSEGYNNDSQTEEKQHISLIQASTESTLQQHQLPFKILSMVHAQDDQPFIDEVLNSELGNNVILDPSALQSIGLGQQLHSVLNIANPNQIYLPVQSVPLSKNARQTISNQTHGLQMGQQLSDLHTVFLPTSSSSTANDASSLVSVVEFTKNVSASNTGASVQATFGNTRLQHTNMMTSCASASKHRPIRPKLLPVPTPAPKISFMLVPDKSGCAAFQLTPLDPSVLSFQQISEQKEKSSSSQLQIVSHEPQSSALVTGTSQQLQNVLFVPGNSQQSQNTNFVPGNSQHAQNTIFVPSASQQKNIIVVPRTSQQSQNTVLVPETLQQQNRLIITGHPQESQNNFMTAGTTQKQRPTPNTAIMTQLQPDQQSNITAQILLVSEPHSRQGVQNLDKHTFSKQEKENQQYNCQKTNNSSIQTLPVRDHRHESASQQASESEIQTQQSLTMQQNQSHMTLIAYETPEMPLLESNDFKAGPLHSGHFQLVPSQNKECQITASHERPAFIDSLQGDSFSVDALHGFEVSSLQNTGCDAGSALDVDASNLGTSQICSLPSRSLQNNIQRLNPQISSQLNGQHLEMITQQHFQTNTSTGQGHVVVKSSSLPAVQTAQPVLKDNQFSGSDSTRLDSTSSTLLLQSKLVPDNNLVIPVENKDKSKLSQTVTQTSCHFAGTIPDNKNDVLASHSLDAQTHLSCSTPLFNPPATTSQLLKTLIQPSTMDIKSVPSKGDVKPVLEPVQYLQCKEVIDLTDDSPPLSPSSNLQNKGKILGLYPLPNDQTQPNMFDELCSLLLYENSKSNQQSTAVIPVQFQRFFQQNLSVENLHVPQKWDLLKQELEEAYRTPSGNVQDNMVLMTSVEVPATEHSVVQTVSPGDDLTYSEAFLSTNVSVKQVETHLNSVAKDICNNKSQNSVITIPANQQFHHSLDTSKLLEHSLELTPLASYSRLYETALVKEDNKRLSQTTRTSNTNNLNSKLPSLSVVGTPVTPKQFMDLSSATQGQIKCPSTVEITAPVLSDQSSSCMTSSSPSAFSNHRFHLTSSPSVLSTPLAATLQPNICATRPPLGRIVLHPLTSSTVAFVRTTNTPTDAVGPPNITIMSPAQANSSPLLRFHHDNSSVSDTPAVISHAATSSFSNPLSLITKGQSSNLLKLTSSTTSTSAPIKLQGSQDTRDSTLLLCPGSGGKDKSASQSARLSLESTPQTSSLKDAHTPDVCLPNLDSKMTDNKIKSAEPPPPSKPRVRKRQSTVMDLLKNKEKLQATASTAAASSLAMNNTPGPVTLMISGTPGSPNLLVMDTSTGQPRVDSNTLNFTVKNLQLLGKLTSNTEKVSVSSSLPSSSQSSGFTILQPNILHASLSSTCHAVSVDTSTAVIKESSTASLASIPSTSLIDNYINATNTTALQPTIYLPIQKVTNVTASSSPFLGNFPQSKLVSGHKDVSNQQGPLSSQSSASQSGCGNQEMEVLMPSIELCTLGDTSTNINASTNQSTELKHNSQQEVLKKEAEIQLLLIGQPQIATSLYKGKQTTVDLLAQKPQAVRTESSYGEVLKFKTAKSSCSEDRNQEMASLKLQLLEDPQKKQLFENGATKKLLLLNDKLPGSETPIKQANSFLIPGQQVGQSAGQISAEQKKLSFKSPQLLQLMKSKQPFSHAALDTSASYDKNHQLKLPTSSVSMPVLSDSAADNSRHCGAVQQASYHPSNQTSQQKDQLPAIKTNLIVSNTQLRGAKSGLVETDKKDPACESSSDTRRNLLPSQNPLLANILFTSINSATSSNFSSVSVSKSSLYLDNHTKNLLERRNSVEENPHIGSFSLGHQTSISKQLEDQSLEKKTERFPKHTIDEPFKYSLDYRSGATKASLKATSDSKSESIKVYPMYSQPPRYEVATKDRTRVNRVIEDIYKFPDEGEESSPPPAFAGWKSQNDPQKFTFVHSGSSIRKSSDSSHESNVSNPPLSTENVPHCTLSKSNIKPNTTQCTPEQSAGQQVNKLYHLSESSTWRNIKKLRHKKDLDKLSNKFNLKKVQFSDVVTSKSVSEYGQSITVSSHIDAVPSEVPSSYSHDAKILRSHQELTEIQNQQSITHYLSGQHQSSTEDSQAVCGRHPCIAEQLQADPKEYKLKVCHAGQIETSLPKAETTSAYIKDTRDKTSELIYIQREGDGLFSSDFEAEKHGKETHRVLSYQHLPKVNHRVSAATFIDHEQDYKRRDEEDTGPVEAFRHIDSNQYPFQTGFMQESMENISSLVSDKTEAHILSIPNTLRSSNQTLLMDTFKGMSNCADVAHGKVEGSVRELTKRRQSVHDESFQFNAEINNGTQMAEKKHITDKKEILSSLADNITVSTDRDSASDQQSSFNILSTQGYSKLSRQRLNRTHCDQLWIENSTSSTIKSAHLTSQGLSTSDTSCSSDHFEETRDFPQQTRPDSISTSNASSSENVERQSSESPMIRQKILETNFELARQMKKGRVQILKDSRSEDFEVRKLESPQKFIAYPERKLDGMSNSLIHRGTDCQMNKELEYRTGTDSVLASPTFLTSLDGRSDVLSSIESITSLRKEIKGLRGENHYLKLEVAKAEQQRQRQLSSTDKQKGILIEAEKAEKIYYTSPCPSSQSYMVDVDTVMPPRKRHSSTTTALGILNCSPLPGSEQNRSEEGFLSKSCHPSVTSCGIQQILESDNSFSDANLRGNVYGSMYIKSVNNIDDYSPPENYIKDTKDPFVSSSMGGHSRPNSHLELGIPQYESTRNRYPSSEMKSISSRGISDDEGFAPLQEHTRHRNLSSSLGLRALFDDPPPYDITQRQRNPSASSLKSTFQDADLPSFDLGARSRNPSSSSWIRYWDYTTDINFTAVRSRNPSGSSNRRSRPGSSSSDRELPVNMDEFPLFSEFARTRSRNSSGESIEPTVEFLDPQQFIQYTYPATDVHIKRTKH